MQNLQLSTETTWLKLADEVAKLMACHPSELRSHLGYHFPANIKSGKNAPKPKMLDGEMSMQELTEDIHDHVRKENAKNRGKGPATGLITKVSVRLVEIVSEPPSQGSAKVSLSFYSHENKGAYKYSRMARARHHCRTHQRLR